MGTGREHISALSRQSALHLSVPSTCSGRRHAWKTHTLSAEPSLVKKGKQTEISPRNPESSTHGRASYRLTLPVLYTLVEAREAQDGYPQTIPINQNFLLTTFLCPRGPKPREQLSLSPLVLRPYHLFLRL